MNITEAVAILQECHYPEYQIGAKIDGRGEMYLQATYLEADVRDPKRIETQYTRRWFISPEMSKSELVQTAFKCIITSMEHRVREHFKYRKRAIFGPHYNVDSLWDIAHSPQQRREGE